jgi:hypothetical protein
MKDAAAFAVRADRMITRPEPPGRSFGRMECQSAPSAGPRAAWQSGGRGSSRERRPDVDTRVREQTGPPYPLRVGLDERRPRRNLLKNMDFSACHDVPTHLARTMRRHYFVSGGAWRRTLGRSAGVQRRSTAGSAGATREGDCGQPPLAANPNAAATRTRRLRTMIGLGGTDLRLCLTHSVETDEKRTHAPVFVACRVPSKRETTTISRCDTGCELLAGADTWQGCTNAAKALQSPAAGS